MGDKLRQEFEEFRAWKQAREAKGARENGVAYMPTETKQVTEESVEPTTIQLSEDEVEPVKKAHQFIQRAKTDLAQLVLTYERKKDEIRKLIDENQQVLDERMNDLREEHGFPEDAQVDLQPDGTATVTW